MSDPDWRELSDAERAAVQPFLLDCSALSARDSAQVRADFILAATTAVQRTAEVLGRVPSTREIGLLRKALAEHFNSIVIPPLAERAGATLQ